jgi:7-cyano-7-deazaguanine synthase
VLLSGGIDSATCLYLARKRGYSVRALTVVFHRIASGEVSAAKAIAKAGGSEEHRLYRMPDMKEAGDMPGSRLRGVPPTYVPLRNSIFYGVAASYAEEVGADLIIGGHNRDDQSIFDDTKDEFFESLQESIWAASRALRDRKTVIMRPLSDMTKPEVIRMARSLKVPLELTWSCHREGTSPCWDCAGCRARVKSFAESGVYDPLAPQAAGIARTRGKS